MHILKRLLYGRRYSMPTDRFFQDGILKKAREHKIRWDGREECIKTFGIPPEFLNNATDEQREGAYAFYLSETMAHKAKPKLLINTDNKGGEKWEQVQYYSGWDDPARSKEVRR
jgi:hypothetical protein